MVGGAALKEDDRVREIGSCSGSVYCRVCCRKVVEVKGVCSEVVSDITRFSKCLK